MKFSGYKYSRPDMDKLTADFDQLLKSFDNCKSAEEQIGSIKKINIKRADFDTMQNISHVRHSIDTTDKFYDDENAFFDQNMPVAEGIKNKFYQALVKSKFRKELEKKLGRHIFGLADMALKTFKPEVLEDLQKENRLVSEHQKLMASAKIMFEGEERNLEQLMPFQESSDRSTRKKAMEAYWGFLAKNKDRLDNIFDQMVKCRTTIAKKLGYKSFTELAYLRMGRSDYNPDMVANFRRQVKEHLVPVAVELRKRQAKRIGISPLKFYDEPFRFKTGNAKPHGPADWIINNAKQMYKELSGETEEFFNFMIDNELMDLLAKKGKAGGGYCTEFVNYKAPFIFANFNGTAGDIHVLTHEAGHAFMGYLSRDQELLEYRWPTMEACEIHSMSMEFFTLPWMKLFFESEAGKFEFMTIGESLIFIPIGVSIDEFQHVIYDNPDMSPDERHNVWHEIEKKYIPYRDYDGFEYLERGCYWQRIPHIFHVPFYYIDYTLAQICALQFWKKMNENSKAAWNDYLKLCKAGGSDSFLHLVNVANLKSPFENDCIKSVISHVNNWVNKFDDSRY